MPRKKKTEEPVVEESVIEEATTTEETTEEAPKEEPKKKTTRKRKTTEKEETEHVKGEIIPTAAVHTDEIKSANTASFTESVDAPSGCHRSTVSVLYDEMSADEFTDWKEASDSDGIVYIDNIPSEKLDELVEATIKHSMSPSQYFKALKELTGDINTGALAHLVAAASEKLKKFSITRQKKLAEETIRNLETLMKEMNAVEAGYTSVINTNDLSAWVIDVDRRADDDNTITPIRVVELESYMRDIPDSVFEKMTDAQPYFDKFFIVFTDYTGETTRQCKEEERDKDPVLFGAFMETKPNGKLQPGPHLFFIDDWIDEYCDLTFTQLLSRSKVDIDKELLIPDTDLVIDTIEKAKALLNIGKD